MATLLCLVVNFPAARAEVISLASIRPVETVSFCPGRDVKPRSGSAGLQGFSPGEVLRFAAESEVTYAIPEGQNLFSGVVIYRADPKAYAPLLLRIWNDGKLVWEHGLSGDSPAVEFFVPVTPGSRMTIESESVWVTSFYLANAQFSRGQSRGQAGYVVPANQGYVDLAPAIRQQVVRIYYPGETVPISAYYSGMATQAVVDIDTVPEWRIGSGADSKMRLVIPLRTTAAGLTRGMASWTVPTTRGPAKLHVKEVVADQVVFERELRIGIGPKFDLAGESDSIWGIHLSGTGYPTVFDHFAGLWGAKWGRMFLRWKVIENTQGAFDFTSIDQLVNLYRAQHMRVLMVVGEDAPSWAGFPGPACYAAWKRFVNAAVHHLAGRVDAWEVFNEVDAKYYEAPDRSEPDWDVKIMHIAMEATQSGDPGRPIVCCSTVTPLWLAYNRRIFQEGLLDGIDIVSLHPYQHGAPEERFGEFTYQGRIAALRNLETEFSANKPIWATEANWIIGQGKDRSVPEPDMTEEEQAEYVARMNLLSAVADVKFFLHSPYAHVHHTEIHLSTWAAYAQTASFFSDATSFELVRKGPQVFALRASTGTGELGALWTAYGNTSIRLYGGRDYQFFDMYGNAMAVDPDSVRISGAPVYFRAQGTTKVQLLSHERGTSWKRMADLAVWTCASHAKCTAVADGKHVLSQPSTGGFQLVSPVNRASAGSCQMARLKINVDQGMVSLYAVDGSGARRLSPVVAAAVEDPQPHSIELRFQTPDSGAFKLVAANGNTKSVVSSFTLFNPPEISECP